jgi:serine/threonine protein phosphatase 1
MTIYAVGDIHGHLDQLEQALELIAADGGPDAEIVFLGDYADRGPDVRGVLERLSKGQAEGRPWTCLLGNHDRMLRRFAAEGRIDDPAIRSGATWLHPGLGGAATLASYGIDLSEDHGLPESVPARFAPPRLPDLSGRLRAAMPAAHLALLDGLPRFHRTKDQIFVHAGLLPGRPLDEQAEDDLVWMREPFLSNTRDHGALVVHGHTALPMPWHYGNRLNMDGGAGYGRRLRPAAIEGRDAWLLTPGGREPLEP